MSYLGLYRDAGYIIRDSTSWKRAENVHRAQLCHRENPITLVGTHFRHVIRRTPRVSDSKAQKAIAVCARTIKRQWIYDRSGGREVGFDRL